MREETKAAKLARLEDEKLAKQKRWNDIAVERKLCVYVEGKITMNMDYLGDMQEAGRSIRDVVEKEWAMMKKKKDEEALMASF